MNDRPASRSRKHIRVALKLAAVMVGAGLLLTLARQQGWIDNEMVVRAYNVVMGLAFAAYGNLLPKLSEPAPRSLHEATVAQAIGRVTSWAMTLAFLVWAVLWAFAPQDLALIGSLTAVGASVVVTVGYTVWKYNAGRASRSE
jgi:hypothetical protein